MELAKAYVQIIPSADGISGKLSSALGGEASTAGDAAGKTSGESFVKKIIGVIAAAEIGKKVVQGISAAINEGAALEQSIGGIETLFKDSAGVVEEYAKNAYATAGLSANSYMETVTGFSASLLQSLGGDTSKAAEISNMALTDMSDNANKMGTDMQDIQNAYQGFAKQNYTMLDNLKLGYGGTKSEMERLLADATKISGVEYNLDNLSDVYQAIHVIQGQLDITGTTAKEAATTISGSFASMKSAFSNVLGNLALGENLQPSLTALVQTTGTFLFDNLLPAVGNVITGIPSAIGTVLTESMPTIIENGSAIISGIINGMSTSLPNMANMGLTTLQSALNVITANMPSVLANGASILTSLADGFMNQQIIFLTNVNTLLSSILNFITANLPSILESGGELLVTLANGFFENIPNIITQVGTMLDNIIDFILANLPAILETGGDILLELVDGFINNLPSMITSVISMLANIVKTIGEHLPEILQKGIELIGKLAAGIITATPKLVSKLPEVFNAIIDAFGKIDWKDIGINIIKGIANGLLGAIGTIVDAAKEAAQTALDTAKKALGIHSPSRVFKTEVGKMVDLGMAAGIEENIEPVQKSMQTLSSETVGMIDTSTISVSTDNMNMIGTNNDSTIVSMLQIVQNLLMDLNEVASDGVEISWNDRNLGRLVRQYVPAN